MVIKVNTAHSREHKRKLSDAPMQKEIMIETYPACTVFVLKYLVWRRTEIAVVDQVLTYHGVTLENTCSMANYGITEVGAGATAIDAAKSSLK